MNFKNVQNCINVSMLSHLTQTKSLSNQTSSEVWHHFIICGDSLLGGP